jgi:hypothetical protein
LTQKAAINVEKGHQKIAIEESIIFLLKIGQNLRK